MKRVGTHDGRFHADEVMATAILKEIFKIELTRTRDEKVLKKLDIVYDVGGGEFDHHGIEKVYRENGIPYAACGLIWNKFGKDVIKSKDPSLTEEEIDSVFSYIDRKLIEGIDALDNGVKLNDGEISVMNISTVIAGFNPAWNSKKDDNEAFNEVVEMVSAILKNVISHRLSVIKSTDKVVKAYEKRTIPEILVLDSYCPYREALQEVDKNNEVLFVVYGKKDNYTLQTVRGADGEDRKKLPLAWAGKRDQELEIETGVQGAVFCHTGRFIAVASTPEGIMKMAKLAIEEPEERKAKGIFSFITSLFSKK